MAAERHRRQPDPHRDDRWRDDDQPKTSTVKTPIAVELDTLTTWNNIPEVGKAVSGTGHYEATFNWDADAATGAYLDLGDTLESSMEVWINGKKVGGERQHQPDEGRRRTSAGWASPPSTTAPASRFRWSARTCTPAGSSWTKPVADVTPYLVDGQNEIVIEYASVLSNVQLDRRVVTETQHNRSWWNNSTKYLEFGPKQAKVVPFVEVEYPAATLDNLVAEVKAFAEAGALDAKLAANLVKFAQKAAEFAEAGQAQAADSQLRSFLNQIGAATDKKATEKAKDELTQLATVIRGQLGA